MFTLSKKKGSYSLALVIGLLLTPLVSPSYARNLTCLICESGSWPQKPPCEIDTYTCVGLTGSQGEAFLCFMKVTTEGSLIKGCGEPNRADLLKYTGSTGFRGCKLDVKDRSTKHVCVCDTDKCNVDDPGKYPSTNESNGSKLRHSLFGVAAGGGALLIIAYLNNLFASAHPRHH